MKEYYRKLIVEMINKIHSEKLLCRIYKLAEYLYLREDNGGVSK